MRIRTWILNSLVVASFAAVGCGGRLAHNLPPSQQLMHPGPGVGGPGPGVIPPMGQMPQGPGPMAPQFGPGGMPPMRMTSNQTESGIQPSIQQVQYCGPGAGMGMPPTSQISFVGEEGLQVAWDASSPGMFDSAPLYVPGRQDFAQGAIYRLKLDNIPGRAGVTLYPTLEVAPVTPRTDAYLAHAPVPVQFTEEDFDQVISGNFVTKVVYLPDPEFQELALSGVETLVSTRLDPGVDPVAEADRRGSILAVLRIGSKDLRSNGGYDGVMPAGYSDSGYGEGDNCYEGGDYDTSYGGGNYTEGGYTQGGGMMPQGMPTAGFAPTPVPPHMIAGMNPQYGMPYTGTPIGLPGPPHIPLGSPAGLRKHVMVNRTKVVLPPPTPQLKVSVKQRPGINYPRPVNKVKIDEVHRAPFKLFGGTVPSPLSAGGGIAGDGGVGGACEVCE